MAHGAPDASNVVLIGQDYRLDNLAELAARLGSPMTYQREGDLFAADTFDSGLGAWGIDVVGLGSEITLQNIVTLSESVAVQFKTGAVGGAKADLTRHFPLTRTGRIGLSAGLDIGTNKQDVHIILGHYTGTHYYYGRVWWDVQALELKCIVFGGGTEVITTDNHFSPDLNLFARVKLVVDLVTMRYVSLTINEASWDLSSKRLARIVSGVARSYAVVLGFNGDAGGIYVSFLDNVILTRNER